MRAPESVSTDIFDARFLRAVAAWCAHEGMSARAFGIAALGDPDFVAAFRRGRSPRLSTVDRVLAFMGEPPAGPAFRAEVEAFLAVTGIKRSVLGSGATGNRSFVAHLREGVSPTLATVGRIRTWMAACASAEELKEVRNRAGAASAILAFERSPPQERPPRSGTDELRQERPADPRDGRAFVSTSEAADRLGLSPRTLDRFRTTDEGPAFHRFGGRVRYRRGGLEAWATARRRVPVRVGAA